MFQKLKEKVNISNIIPLVLLLMVIISGFATIFTYSVGLNYYDGFDYLEDVYWAKATLESKSLVNPEYNYVYLLPFGANLIMAPFVALFGVGLLANRLGIIAYFILYLLVLYYFVSSLFDSYNERFYSFAIISLFIYTLVGDSLLHHILAYGIGFVCLLGELGSIINIYKNNKVTKIHYILLTVFSLWSSLNGVSVFGLSSLIIFVSFVCFLYLKQIDIKHLDIKIKKAFLYIVVSTIIGLLIFRIINNGRYNGAFVFCDRDLIIHKLFYDLYNDLFNILGFNPGGVLFFSARGILSFAKLFLLLFIITLSLVFIFKYKNKNDIDIFICLNCIVLIVVCFAQYLFGAYASERTLFNAILGILILAAVSFNKSFKFIRGKDIALVCLIVITLFFSYKQIVAGYKRGNEILNQKLEIANILIENDLSFGYSTSFDYARQLSVVSQEKNETILALYSKEENKFNIETTHTFPYERNKPLGIDKTYIIIPNNEIYNNGKDNEKFEDLIDNSIETIELNDCTVFVFNMSDFEKVFDFE